MGVGLAAAPEQGQLVSVRSRNWMVNEVAPSTLPASGLRGLADAQTLVTLTSVEDDGLGEEAQVVWELEPGARVIEKVALPEPTGFDPPDQLNAFLDAVRWGASSSADVRNIQAPFRSGIDIEDYQLDPVVRAIRMPRVNLLVADDVGLGKTIEAGMVALELIIRHRARKVLIVCPSSLQVQWQEQMRDKFGLDFRIVGGELMRELRRERGIHVNPWNHFPCLITSIDFLKRERPLRMFREILPGPDDPLYPRKFDLPIVDEAHNCAPSGRGKYATDSLRTKALRLLAPHFEHKLFLSATPHNGYPESFSALLELLDSQRFARSTPPDRKQLDAVMVRRMKSELPPRWDGSPRFPRRVLEPLEVPYTDEEQAIHAALKRYADLRSKRARDNAESVATDFVLKTLKKRLFSSPAAFLTTLNKHEASLRASSKKAGGATPSLGMLKRDLDRIDEDYADDEEYDEATGEAVETASRLFSEATAEELGLIRTMRDWAERACSQNDSKARKLIAWLNEHIRPGGQWADERIILFTEYRATQKWLSEVLASEGLAGQDRMMTMYGGMDSKHREAVKAAFQSSPAQSPVRILLATDAASEGLDLQNHCSRLVHYEVPWNPNRMEQRNGRIDRHGQKADLVRVFHFVSQGYNQRRGQTSDVPAGELEADLEFLMRVAQKVETIREDLGSVGQVLADDVEAAMLGRGYNLARTETAERGSEPVRRMLKFERDLARQIQELLEQYRQTQKELRLSPANIQKVVEVGLRLAEQPPLIPVGDPGGQVDLPAAVPAGKLGGVRRGAGAPAHEGDSPDHVRPCGVERAGRRGARPPEPPAGADVPAAPAGRGLVRRRAQEVAPDRGSGGPGPRPAEPGGDRPRPPGGHRRRQPPAARGDHHGGRLPEGGPFQQDERRPGGRGVVGGERRGALGGDEGAVPEALGRPDALAPAGAHGPHGGPHQGVGEATLGAGRQGGRRHRIDPAGVEAGDRGRTGRVGVPATRTVQRPGAGAVRAEQGLPAGAGEADPRRDRAGDGGDPIPVHRSAGPDVPRGGDVPGARTDGASLMAHHSLFDTCVWLDLASDPFADEILSRLEGMV
jgi:superfamily II DNA or RNA helicase